MGRAEICLEADAWIREKTSAWAAFLWPLPTPQSQPDRRFPHSLPSSHTNLLAGLGNFHTPRHTGPLHMLLPVYDSLFSLVKPKLASPHPSCIHSNNSSLGNLSLMSPNQIPFPYTLKSIPVITDINLRLYISSLH